MHAPSQGTMGNRPTNIHTQGSNLYVKNMCSLAGAGQQRFVENEHDIYLNIIRDCLHTDCQPRVKLQRKFRLEKWKFQHILLTTFYKNYTCGQKMRDISAVLCYCGCIVLRKMLSNITRVVFFLQCRILILVLMLVFVRSSPSSRIFKSILKHYITTIIYRYTERITMKLTL